MVPTETIHFVNSQEVNTMKLSKEIINQADRIIFNYAKFDKYMGFYTLTLNDVDSYDVYKLSSLIMAENKDLASEATGPDNDLYERSMLPSLISYMSNSNNKDFKEDYLVTWNEGIVHYLQINIEELLNSSLEEFNASFNDNREEDVWAA